MTSPLTTEESVEGVITAFSLIIRADFSREDVESTLVGGDFPVPGKNLLCQELAAGEYILEGASIPSYVEEETLPNLTSRAVLRIRIRDPVPF